MSGGINAGDDVSILIASALEGYEFIFPEQKLIFESSEAVPVVSTFDDLGLKEDLLRGIYAYSTHNHISSSFSKSHIM